MYFVDKSPSQVTIGLTSQPLYLRYQQHLTNVIHFKKVHYQGVSHFKAR